MEILDGNVCIYMEFLKIPYCMLNSSEILHRALFLSLLEPNVKDITNGNHPKKFGMVEEEEKLVLKKYIIHKK